MASPQLNVDSNEYNAVVKRTTLLGIWMMECKFDMKPRALDVNEVPLSHDLKVEMDEVVADAEGRIYAFIKFDASSRRQRQRVLQITAKYFVRYEVAGGCDQPTAELFIDRVGRLATYPYFRALVASLAGQGGVQIPPLPVISFQPRGIDFVRDAKLVAP